MSWIFFQGNFFFYYIFLSKDDGKLSFDEFKAYFSDGVLSGDELKELFHAIDTHNTKYVLLLFIHIHILMTRHHFGAHNKMELYCHICPSSILRHQTQVHQTQSHSQNLTVLTLRIYVCLKSSSFKSESSQRSGAGCTSCVKVST